MTVTLGLLLWIASLGLWTSLGTADEVDPEAQIVQTTEFAEVAKNAQTSQVAPSSAEVEDALPEGGSLTGREIYDRFLRNKFRRSIQRMRVVSRDPGGSEQTTTFKISLEDFRDENENATKGVLAKMLVEVSDPFDMRNTSYLIIAKDPGPDDEFIYQPTARRVRRVALKKIPLMGTDYTFDDIAYHNVEGAEYKRLPDEEIDGTPVYVVESLVEDTRAVEYHRTLTYLEKEHYVPLRIRYWDDFDVEIKVMTSERSSLKAYDDVWVASESTMHDLLQHTSSTLHVDHLKTEPKFSPKLFTLANLTQGL